MSNPLDVLLAPPPAPPKSSDFRWATVTSASPLLVRLDGDTVPLPDPVPMLGGTAALGDRVGVILHNGRAVGVGRPAPAAVSLATAWTTPSYSSGWTDYGAGFQGVQYRRTADGSIELRGMAKSGTDPALFTLPDGFRPAATLIFFCPSTTTGGLARVDVYADGWVRVQSYSGGGSNAWVSLSNVAFARA